MLRTQPAAASWSSWSSEPMRWMRGCGSTKDRTDSRWIIILQCANAPLEKHRLHFLHMLPCQQQSLHTATGLSKDMACKDMQWLCGDSLRLHWHVSLCVCICMCVFSVCVCPTLPFQTMPQQRGYSCEHTCFCKFVQMKVVQGRLDIKNLSMNHTTWQPFRHSKGQIISDY